MTMGPAHRRDQAGDGREMTAPACSSAMVRLCGAAGPVGERAPLPLYRGGVPFQLVGHVVAMEPEPPRVQTSPDPPDLRHRRQAHTAATATSTPPSH